MSSGGKKGGKKGNKGSQGENPEGEKAIKFDFGGIEGKDLPLKFDFSGKDSNILPFIQKRLGALIGKSSGYLEQLPPSVQNRVKALKHLHEKKKELDKEYKKELLALQDKFDKLVEPLFQRRKNLIQGTSEPSEEETKEEKKEEEKTEEKKEEKEEEKKEEKKEEIDVKGIPAFWMEAFKHHPDFSEMITQKDEDAMKHLIDVRWTPITDEKYSAASFNLEFEFSENPYFTNKVITKTYYLTEDSVMGETMFDRMESSTIEWKAGKNLTVETVKVQQPVGGKRGGRNNRGRGRGKSQMQTKTVTVEQPCESFFNFFNQNLSFLFDDEEELEEDDMQELYETDYEMGLVVKEQIIPSAILWFTGEIETNLGGFGEMDESDEDGDVEEYDSAEDADFEPNSNQPQEKPECKQQ